MRLPDLESLRSSRTARTYPVKAQELLAAIQRAVERLPQWTLGASEENEIRAARETRLLRLEDDVRVRLTPHSEDDVLVGTSYRARAEFQSTSSVGLWDFGQNERNLRELLEAVDQELVAKEGLTKRSGPSRTTPPIEPIAGRAYTC